MAIIYFLTPSCFLGNKSLINLFFFFSVRFPLIGVHRVPHLRCSAGYESSGCEIQRWIEKGFAGFVCFGFKKVKLYIIAKTIHEPICG